jgi:CRP-like cAMP-binding protein
MSGSNRLQRRAAELVARHMYPGADAGDVAAVLERGQRARFQPGTRLCREGDPGDTMFVVLEGRVQVLLRDGEGRDRQLAVVEPPALLGHVTLVDRSPRSASCVALDAVDVVTLDGATYEAAIREPSRIGSALRRLLIASLVAQLSSGNARIRDVIEGRDRDVAPASSPERADPPASKAPSKPSARPKPRRKPAAARPPRPPRAAAPQPAARARAGGDVDDDELLKIAGILSGWQIDTRGLDRMKVVQDEDARRSRRRRPTY